MPKAIPPETRAAIEQALAAGRPPQVVAQMFHVSLWPVYKIRSDAKLPKPSDRWDHEPRLYRVPPPEHPLAKLIVQDPEGRIRDVYAGRTWLPHLIGTNGSPPGPEGSARWRRRAP